MVYSECCSNRGGTRKLPSMLGNLVAWYPLRALHGQIGAPRSYVIMYSRTINLIDAEKVTMPPCIKCPLILVEKISSEYDRCKFLVWGLSRKILLKKYICSIQQIKKYGFNHIIVIGEFIYGILCSVGTLWFLGDYSQSNLWWDRRTIISSILLIHLYIMVVDWWDICLAGDVRTTNIIKIIYL